MALNYEPHPHPAPSRNIERMLKRGQGNRQQTESESSESQRRKGGHSGAVRAGVRVVGDTEAGHSLAGSQSLVALLAGPGVRVRLEPAEARQLQVQFLHESDHVKPAPGMDSRFLGPRQTNTWKGQWIYKTTSNQHLEWTVDL